MFQFGVRGLDSSKPKPGAVSVEPWNPAQASEAELAEAFGLLVDAHYRTTPADLRQWLDDPAASSWRAVVQGKTVVCSGDVWKAAWIRTWPPRWPWASAVCGGICWRSPWPAMVALRRRRSSGVFGWCALPWQSRPGSWAWAGRWWRRRKSFAGARSWIRWVPVLVAKRVCSRSGRVVDYAWCVSG